MDEVVGLDKGEDPLLQGNLKHVSSLHKVLLSCSPFSYTLSSLFASMLRPTSHLNHFLLQIPLFLGDLVNKHCCQTCMQIFGALERPENHKDRLQGRVISPWGPFSATEEIFQPWIRENFHWERGAQACTPFPSLGDASGPGAREQRGRCACTHRDAGAVSSPRLSPFSSY